MLHLHADAEVADARRCPHSEQSQMCGHMCSSMSWITKPCSHCCLRPPRNMPQKNDLHSPLLMCRCQLVCPAAGSGIVAEGRLLDLLRRLYCFGVSLMKMDLRQESTRHTEAVDAITRWAGCSPGICTGVLWGDALKPLDARRSGWPHLSHSIMTFALRGWQLLFLLLWRGAPRWVTQQGPERWSQHMLLFCSQSQQYSLERPRLKTAFWPYVPHKWFAKRTAGVIAARCSMSAAPSCHLTEQFR